MDIEKQVAIHMYSFDAIQISNYFEGEWIMRNKEKAKVSLRVSREAAGKDKVTGEM